MKAKILSIIALIILSLCILPLVEKHAKVVVNVQQAGMRFSESFSVMIVLGNYLTKMV